MDFIFIIFTRMQSITRNAAGILVLNSDTDLHVFPDVLGKRKIDF